VSPNFCAVVVAAGRGVRFGRPKQMIDIAGHPLVSWSLQLFGSMPELAALVIATEAEFVDAMRGLASAYAPSLESTVVAGGATRQQSVRNALRAVPERCTAVLVHDGARPLVREVDVRAGMAAVRPGVGAVLAAPMVDTVKVVKPGTRTVLRTLDRRELWAAQTPQFGMLDDMLRAHAAAERDGVDATDDVALLEHLGLEVVVVPASGENLKVTHPNDTTVVEAIMRDRLAQLDVRGR
jgi:2-C-methyl-D-erythritol 4-phosphate cytidylyltransferase